MEPTGDTLNFFISYNRADGRWAEWIAWELEQAGYRTELMAWDFGAGSNFVLKMQSAAAKAEHTIILLSPTYLKSDYCAPEWAAAFAQDPTGKDKKLIPVRVMKCEPEGLLKQIVYIDLLDTTEEEAKRQLLARVQKGRAKPAAKPGFPGVSSPIAASSVSAPLFPGALPCICTIPHPPNPHFTGRDELLERLHENLNGKSVAAITQPQAVHGLGGVGKTQMAVEYAYRHRSEYDAVLWVVADSPEAVAANLAALTKSDVLNLPESSATQQEVQTKAVVQWLKSNRRWLLIFDNADTKECVTAVRGILSAALAGHVIITSRITHWPLTIATIPVDKLSPEAAKVFLLERWKSASVTLGSEKEAEALARELDGLPLALEQAAAYMLRHRISCQRYLELLKTSQAKLLKEPVEGATGYQKSVAETWLVTEQKLSLLARGILRLLGFMAPEEFPRFVFQKETKALEAIVKESGDSTKPEGLLETVENALAELAEYSLISLSAQSLSSHRLMQAVQLGRLSAQEYQTWLKLALELLDELVPRPADDVRNWPVWESMVAHVKALVGRKGGQSIQRTTSGLMTSLGILFLGKALFIEAEPLMRQALEIDEANYGRNHPAVAIQLNNLAQLLQTTNRLGEAEPLMRRALEICEVSYGKNHPAVAIQLNNLAQLLQTTNRLGEAEPLMRRALEIDEASYGKGHPRLAVDLNNLALLLQATNRLGEAEPLMRRALETCEVSYGKNHPAVAIQLNNLAQLLQDTNRLLSLA